MKTVTFIAVAAFVALLIGGVVGVYAYDKAHEDTVAEGVKVGGIAVGGLSRADARQKLREELLQPLSSPVVVRARGHAFRLSAREARIAANVDGMVDEAIREGRRGNILSRTLRGLTGEDVDADVSPRVTYSREAVSRLVARVERRVDRPARDAKVDFSPDGLKKVDGRDGAQLDRRQLRTRVESALLRPGESQRIVIAKVDRVRPKVTTRELARKYDTVVIVNRGAFRLRLFKHLKLVKTYPIAVGQVGLETPAGLYNVQNKAINPAWNVPDSPWAGDKAGQVIPGGVPENPLKARWLGIYDGAGIHGTDQRGSIGTNASHGCIRMLVEDVIELYDKVPVGAPVYIA